MQSGGAQSAHQIHHTARKNVFTYVQPETQRQTYLKAHLGTDPNGVIVPCCQNGEELLGSEQPRTPRMPSNGLQSVHSSSRELLDPCMMSKAHVVGGFLGDFICWISTGDDLWTILGESCRHGTGKLTKLRSFDSFENDRYTLKYMYDPSFTENHCSFSKDNQDVANRRMDKVVPFCDLHRPFVIISYNIDGFIN